MNVAFRVDASVQIGSGHVMRCLTLATALRERDARCHFICRAHEGHLADAIRQRGFDCHLLPACSPRALPDDGKTEPGEGCYADWLGTSWEEDAQQCASLLAERQPDWLIVDHYALDRRWENALRTCVRRLLVIDDLANRSHDCDLLLDQNLGRQPDDYAALVPPTCELAIGPAFALLRPDFAELRELSLQRRESAQLRSLLISMGGVDQANATGTVLRTLRNCRLAPDCTITVVMGAHAPWLAQVRMLAEAMPWRTEVKVNVRDMAQLTADCDFAIGAAGSTAWERCCLGVPSAIVILADNQRLIANALSAVGACWLLGQADDIASRLPTLLASADPAQLATMSANARRVTDGQGTTRVLEKMNHVDT